MLKTLNVWNFALIENVNIEFDEGLNILTGETGAGKSILIDALGIVLGNRANISSIRNGCEQLRVEAVFVNLDNKIKNILSEFEIEVENDTLIINRKINRNGKSSIIVNSSHITLNLLKKIGNVLIDVHGQNENLALLREDSPYNLIDNSSKNISNFLNEYQKLYRLWLTQKKLLEEKKKSAVENEQRLDMLSWQEKEIADANLKLNEDTQLELEIHRLSHAEKIVHNVKESCQILNGDDDSNVLTSLAVVIKNLEDMNKYDDSLQNACKMIEEAAITLNEAFSDIRNYSEQFEYSPEKLDELQKRMEVIYRLKKKYGATIDEILIKYDKIKQELATIENFDADVELMEQRILKIKSQARKRADILTNARKKTAKSLSSAIEKELHQLGMEKAKFELKVNPIEQLNLTGGDEIDMLFSANVGEEVQSLSKIASGGELSRIALAIKAINADRDDSAATMVFDEIDTGLGGKTANAVAECIVKVAKYKQVLCITHLPQIACMADVHIQIGKYVENERTVTKVYELSEIDRLKEIARMASGDDKTIASIKNANEMLVNAAKKKRAIMVKN